MLPKFIRLDTGSYVNLDFVLAVVVVGSSSTWNIQVDYEPGGYTNLDKTWATQQEAEDALIQIFQPIDVAIY